METLKQLKLRDCDNSTGAAMLHIDNTPAMMDCFDSVGIVRIELDGKQAYLSIDQCQQMIAWLSQVIIND